MPFFHRRGRSQVGDNNEVLEKSHGLEDVLNALYHSGTNLWKVRSPRNWYRRKFILDLSEMKLKYDPSYKTTCINDTESNNIDVCDIVDVRKGWKTDTFNKVGTEQEKKSKAEDNKTSVEEKNCFSIIYGPKKETLDLVAPNPDIADKWVRALQYLISWHTSKEQEKSYENWLRKKFLSADLDGNKCLSFPETIKLIEELNIHMHENQALKLFNEANTKRASRPEFEVLDEDEFIQFYFNLLKRPEIETLFNNYSSTRGILKANELCQFLQKEQSDFPCVSVEECEDLIALHEQSDLKTYGQMSCAGFLNMLLSTRFDIFNENQKTIYQDMDQPLSHYYISSSHNTYLLGNQLSSQSSIEGYADALRRGCRCVELDLWDGEELEPMITHGFTLTSKIYLKEVLKDVIKPYAFTTSKYPLILSLENHCTPPYQQKIADYLQEILGDLLYKENVNENMKFLPSPNQLRGKILIKGKKFTPRSIDIIENNRKSNASFFVELPVVDLNNSSTKNQVLGKPKTVTFENRKLKNDKYLNPTMATVESLDDTDESSYDSTGETSVDFIDAKSKKISKIQVIDNDLSSMVNLIQAVHFNSFHDSRMKGKCYQISSFSETKAMKCIETEGQDFIDYNKNQLSRIYPTGSRTGSSNFDPIQFWNVGCQIVALNYQTEDVSNYMNFARFYGNGSCGYILKPEFLRKPTARFDPNEILDKTKGIFLKLRIISGQHLPKAVGNPEIVDPYIEIKIIGLAQDKAMFTTKSIHNNGFNPVWNETFKTRVRCPELAFMYIRVKDYSHSGTDMPLAHYALPITALSPGYRHIQLQDLKGHPLQPSTLFVHIATTSCSNP